MFWKFSLTCWNLCDCTFVRRFLGSKRNTELLNRKVESTSETHNIKKKSFGDL